MVSVEGDLLHWPPVCTVHKPVTPNCWLWRFVWDFALSYDNSPDITLFGMRTVQAGICLNSEQIDTLLISVGGQEGVFGGRGIMGRRPQKCTWVSGILFIVPWRPLFCACRRYQWQKMADLSKWDKYQGHRLHRVYHPHHCLAARRTEKCKRQQPGGKWLAY